MAHIVLIEDNPENATYATRILEGAGHTVKHFSTGLGVARATRNEGADLFLVDFNLPDVDGNVLILTLKRALGGDSSPPFVALTARSDQISRQLATRRGFDAFIGKPFKPQELLDVVNELLGTGDGDG
ncbi:MAG: response regulator [Chloroflexota bacterium]